MTTRIEMMDFESGHFTSIYISVNLNVLTLVMNSTMSPYPKYFHLTILQSQREKLQKRKLFL